MSELQPHEQACSFCHRPRAEVGQLVAAASVSICDACVELCNQILAEAREPAEGLPKARVKDASWRRWLRRVF